MKAGDIINYHKSRKCCANEDQLAKWTCPECGRILIASEQFFYRNSHNNDGLDHTCKECRKAYARKRNKSKN